MSSRPLLLALALALLLIVPAAPPATAAPSKSELKRSRHLWATVNICDTRRHADTMGIRASMPGSGRRGETMWMRFRVQWRSRDGAWKEFDDGQANSGYVRVGRRATVKARQSGWSFPFRPREGTTYTLRGVVDFQWRRRGKPVRRFTERTEKGHRAAVADPRRYSAATCALTGG